MYTGDMVQHTQTKISYKSNKKVTLDEQMWIIVENTHEPLVDKKVFELINKKTKTRNYQKRKRPERLLEGLLYCHECGNRLGVLYRKKHNYWSINCNRYARDPIRRMCEPHFFSYNYFEEILLKEIKKCFTKLFKDLDINELNDEIVKRRKNNSNIYIKKKEELEKEKNKVLNNLETLYKDRLEENISIEQYKLLARKLEKDLKSLNTQMEDINIEIIKQNSKESEIPNYISKIKKLVNINKPNKDLLFALIERIEADKDKNIIIKFKFDILETYTFKYFDNRVRNPHGRYGKKIN